MIQENGKNKILIEVSFGIEHKMLFQPRVMLYSKKPDIFIKNDWPTYFSKAKKCYIWDLNNKKYTDLSFMGVGTNVLGYSNPKVDAAVIKSIKKSNMSTLNNFDEIILAEKLIEIHPWASMVKFARTGGEANSVALKNCKSSVKSK